MFHYLLKNNPTTKRDSAAKWLSVALLGCTISFLTSLLVRVIMVDAQQVHAYSRSMPLRLRHSSATRSHRAQSVVSLEQLSQEHVLADDLRGHKSEELATAYPLVVSSAPVEPEMPVRSSLPAFFVPNQKHRLFDEPALNAHAPDVNLPGDYLSFDNPVLIKKVAPVYPARAKKQGIEGFVVVTFAIRSDGSVHQASVADSNPKRVFDHAALEAVRQFKFKPYAGNQDAARIFSTKITFSRDNSP